MVMIQGKEPDPVDEIVRAGGHRRSGHQTESELCVQRSPCPAPSAPSRST